MFRLSFTYYNLIYNEHHLTYSGTTVVRKNTVIILDYYYSLYIITYYNIAVYKILNLSEYKA